MKTWPTLSSRLMRPRRASARRRSAWASREPGLAPAVPLSTLTAPGRSAASREDGVDPLAAGAGVAGPWAATGPRLATPVSPRGIAASSPSAATVAVTRTRRYGGVRFATRALQDRRRCHGLRERVAAGADRLVEAAPARAGSGRSRPGRRPGPGPARLRGGRWARVPPGLVAWRRCGLPRGSDPLAPGGVLGGLGIRLPAWRWDVQALDQQAEHRVVDDSVDQPDQEQQERLGRVGFGEVQDVVDQAGGEAEVVMDAERRRQPQRHPGEHDVDAVQQRSDEQEGELDRLGDAGDQRGQRRREHDAADCIALLWTGVAPHRKAGGRQAEHHDWEEPGHEGPGVRVAGEEAVQVAVDRTAGPLEGAEHEPDERVDDVVQSEGEQQPVEGAVDAGADRAMGGDEVARVVDAGADRRPDEAEDDPEDQRGERGDDRHEA